MRNIFVLLNRGLLALLLLQLAACQTVVSPIYDVVVRNGLIIDGSGKPGFYADVAIRNGRIAKVGEVKQAGKMELDAVGKIVSPGWIDMMDQSGRVLRQHGGASNKVLMGVTSAIGGEGGTPVPADQIGGYFTRLQRQGIAINFGSYYSAFQARTAVIGETDVPADEQQLLRMQALVNTAMEQGAMGLSSAAFYPPESFLTTHELIAMAKAAAAYDGIYAAHMRDESRQLLSAVEEMITIAEQAAIGVEIFHFKNAYQPHWGSEINRAITLIKNARARGVDITADQYPYVAGGTGIDATVPNWLYQKGRQEAHRLLRDPSIRRQLKQEVLAENSDRLVVASGGWNNIRLANPHNQKYQHFVGDSFTEIGAQLGKDPADAAWDILLEALPKRALALYFLMSEQDVQTIMQLPWVSVGSDAAAVTSLGALDDLGLPHPRAYGTFPRIIAKYVREQKLLSLEQAIRKMTSAPAARMKLNQRGLIKQQYWADLVIFDYASIQDQATWASPLSPATGIESVFVNGVAVLLNGALTQKTPGKILYGPGRVQ